MKRLSLPVFLLVSACAAGPESEPTTDEAALSPDDPVDLKADGADSELYVRVAESSLWVRKAVTRETRDGHDLLVLRGRTSRNLVDGNAFVFDDPAGDWKKLSARTFEVALDVQSAAGQLTGVNQFISLTFTPSNGRPDSLTARALLAPRLTAQSGSGLYLSAQVVAVLSGGRTVFRIHGSAPEKIDGFSVDAGGIDITDKKLLDDTHFQADLLVDHVDSLIGTGTPVAVTVRLASRTVTRRGLLAVAVQKLGLTSGDAYDVWPRPTCADETRACLTGLPPGELDLGPCGDVLAVQACYGQIGSMVGEADVQAAIASAQILLDDPAGFAADASALVGADRALEYREAVRQTVEEHLESQFGTWYPSEAAKGVALAAVTDAAVDRAYARPFDLIEPHAPLAGDAARERQVAADGFLVYMSGLDLTKTEWGRPLEVLARQYRKRHVDSLRLLREQAVPETYSGAHVFINDWLDAMAEVYVDPATGAVTRVSLEID